jgi:protein involved in polysaccharide export with SLBB domain
MKPRRLRNGVSSLSIGALSLFALLQGCAGPELVSGPQFLQRDGSDGQARAFRLGVGDKFKLTVFGEDDLSGQFEVNVSGQVSLPLIGEQQAKDLTIDEFRARIRTKLADGYLKNPKVTVEMLNYRPIYVHGEVKNGGEFQYKNGLKLRDAVAMAGGYTYRADQSFIYIGRDGQADAAVRLPTDVVVLPGDNIRIPERFF